MNRSRYLSTVTLAALLGAAPAWAQFSDSAKTSTAPASAPASGVASLAARRAGAGRLSSRVTLTHSLLGPQVLCRPAGRWPR